MLTKLQDTLRTNFRRNQSLSNASSPKLTASEQTQLSWAKLVESYVAVPESYRTYFDPMRKAGQDFPYCVLTPSYPGFLHQATEKLICDLGNEIHVLKKSAASFRETDFPLEGISSIEYRKVLLDSYIRISGQTKQGTLESSTWRFNSVSDTLFMPFLVKMRGGSMDETRSGTHPDEEKFLTWMQVNYKFMMLAIRSLQGGERVLFFHLQPEIRMPWVPWLHNLFQRTISSTHACILTDREIIIISEEGWYGGIWVYLPLKKVGTVTLNEKGKELLELCIQMKAGTQFKHVYPQSARQEVQGFMEKYHDLKLRV